MVRVHPLGCISEGRILGQVPRVFAEALLRPTEGATVEVIFPTWLVQENGQERIADVTVALPAAILDDDPVLVGQAEEPPGHVALLFFLWRSLYAVIAPRAEVPSVTDAARRVRRYVRWSERRPLSRYDQERLSDGCET
jgi:hypothetical protein